MTVHIGDILKGRYKIVESLGRGGMSEVFKVWDEERTTYLAVKLLHDNLAHDPVFIRRFKREAKNLAQLQHPNIVRFYELEEDEQKAFILMDYIQGVSLQDEIYRAGATGLPLGRVQSILQDVCSALQYAHNRGVIHCDIKPGNVLVDGSGKAYLADFGIARGINTASNTLVGFGTLPYMAPELIRGEEPTAQSDIYALGITLYVMLTGGKFPFDGSRAKIRRAELERVRWEHLNLEPFPLSRYRKISKSMDSLIMHCLMKDPRERFKKVAELQPLLSEEISKQQPEEEKIQGVQDRVSFQAQKGKKENGRIERGDRIQQQKKQISTPMQKSKGKEQSIKKDQIEEQKQQALEKKQKVQESIHDDQKLLIKKNTQAFFRYFGIALCVLLGFILIHYLGKNGNGQDRTSGSAIGEMKNSQLVAEEITEIAVTPTEISITPTIADLLYYPEIGRNFQVETIFTWMDPIKLKKDVSDNVPECLEIGSQKNFILEMGVRCPYPLSGCADYGVSFQGSGNTERYALVFFKDGSWNLTNQSDDGSLVHIIRAGGIHSFQTELTAKNIIEWIVVNENGYLYVNEEFIAKMDLSDHSRAGKVQICAGYYPGDGVIQIDTLEFKEILE